MPTAGPSETGVLLASYGGPESLSEVKPFLRRLLGDFMVTGSVSHFAGLLAKLRHKKAREIYAQIGGGSPGSFQTVTQAQLLADELKRRGKPLPCQAMCLYHRPSPKEAIQWAVNNQFKRVVVVSAFPQWSRPTGGAALETATAEARGIDLEVLPAPLKSPPQGWVKALVDAVRALWRENPKTREWALQMTAHGLPISNVKGGDPYPIHVRKTAKTIIDDLNPSAWSLAWQSRVGPMKWLKPDLFQELKKWKVRHIRGLILLPLSFGCQGSETLWELGVKYQQLAHRLGLSCAQVGVPWRDSGWIEDLAEAVEEALD